MFSSRHAAAAVVFVAVSLVTVPLSSAPRAPNRRASMHRRGALTSLLRARTGLGLCLCQRPTVMSGGEAQRDLTWTEARTLVFVSDFILFCQLVGSDNSFIITSVKAVMRQF